MSVSNGTRNSSFMITQSRLKLVTCLDLAEGDRVDLSEVMAQPQRTDRDPLDGSLRRADVDVLADAEGVVDQEEDARDDVADQRLGAEADGDADDAGTGQQRADVDAERRDDDHADHDDEGDEEELADHRQQRLQPRQAAAVPSPSAMACPSSILVGGMPVDGRLDHAPQRRSEDDRDDDGEAARRRLRLPRLRRRRARCRMFQMAPSRTMTSTREDDAQIAHDHRRVIASGRAVVGFPRRWDQAPDRHPQQPIDRRKRRDEQQGGDDVRSPASAPSAAARSCRTAPCR